MGKYFSSRNWKLNKDSRKVLMEVPGVLTRAKTLALKKAAGSYIQLRHRLIKKVNPSKLSVVNSSTVKVDPVKEIEIEDEDGSFGENMLEIQERGRGRTTRETTPCSLSRDPDIIKTPGSSTKSRIPADTKHRVLKTMPKPVPSTSEMDEFFMGPEKQQQQLFIDKYNFDPVNEKPLHGRYEWVKLDATKKS